MVIRNSQGGRQVNCVKLAEREMRMIACAMDRARRKVVNLFGSTETQILEPRSQLDAFLPNYECKTRHSPSSVRIPIALEKLSYSDDVLRLPIQTSLTPKEHKTPFLRLLAFRSQNEA